MILFFFLLPMLVLYYGKRGCFYRRAELNLLYLRTKAREWHPYKGHPYAFGTTLMGRACVVFVQENAVFLSYLETGQQNFLLLGSCRSQEWEHFLKIAKRHGRPRGVRPTDFLPNNEAYFRWIKS